MTVRTILVPIRGDGKGEGVLDHALSLARRFSAHLDIIHCRPRPEDMLPFGVSVPAILKKDILASAATLADEEEHALRKVFDDYCQRHDLTIVEQAPWPTDRVSASWREKTGKQAAIVAVYGRLADVIAVAQPDYERGLGRNTLEAALLETGRLILVCPPKPADTIGAHVAIAWNGSGEAARAVTAALPILAAADKVTILSVATGESYPLGPDALEGYLANHEIDAEARALEARATEVGQSLLAATAGAGADVLLMGAYGQSRRRELVLGGVTQHVIDHADLPILLTH